MKFSIDHSLAVPLALAAPAAAATLAYLNARTGFSYDLSLIGPAVKAGLDVSRREKNDRLNFFYVLEDHAQGAASNDVFLIHGGREWTYKEVYQTALKYGTWLKTKYNVKPKDIVAMDFMNSEKFVFVWFGLWEIGARPAFINYNLADKALTHCIKVATASLVLVDPEVQHNITQEVRDGLPGVTVEVFTPELEAEAISIQAEREPNASRSESKPQNMAMLIFTSGTTGMPKAAILGLCMVLMTGGSIIIGRKFSTKTFWQEVRASNATVIQYVGETCRYLLTAPPQIDPVTGEDLDKKNKVRMAFGNGLRPDIWNQFKERFGITDIAEFYTATEGSGASWNFSRNDFGKGAIGRLGTFARFISKSASARVVLDWETEQPWRDPKTGFCKRVDVGEPGELLYQLIADDIPKKFQGYYNNPESTESKILRNVFKKGDAWFRTGDMITGNAEGLTYFSDRIGDTFRWKAENVSTNEVSEALGNHAAVHEANVYGVELPHHDGRAGCVAIVLAEQPSEKLMSDLAKHAHERLPRFAVPLFLRLTNDMQMTGTNKQQKHVVRAQGVNPEKVGNDELYWLKNGTYVKFKLQDWEELHGGKVKL
ncbi:hypothetical protein G7Y89_g13372 [Cudoniella acicularis]|uniref:Uncharacterized protein n=1 Tax=Cudoniella acicularis TaxID=354080 RepID=A0A8H4R9H0_9HELO|nr:hypothetical protein G7Y89_g13372 [Cudoniella acicularis]